MAVNGLTAAFGSVPKDGGTFTFYRNMRPVLADYGIDLRCVTIGRREASLVEGAYVDDGCVLLAEDTNRVKKQAMAFAGWCEREKVDIAMAINSIAMLSALPHLPKRIRVIARCARGSDEGYRVTMSGRDRLMRIIALTPRLRDDLIKDYGADPRMIELIPNGVRPEAFRRTEDRGPRPGRRDPNEIAPERFLRPPTTDLRPPESPLQLGFLGRLEHGSKGVLWLPEIVRETKNRGVKFHLRIAGKGKHRPALEKGLRPFIQSGDVELIGALTKDEVPGFLESIDVYLFTSQVEGCPNALLEAMMAGAAPVTFLIDGITDFVLEHGRTGLIAPMGDCEAFAKHIAELGDDHQRLMQMQQATADEARTRFTADVAAAQYARVFKEVMAAPLPEFEPLPWSKFRVDPVYRQGWKGFVPGFVKRAAKGIATGLGGERPEGGERKAEIR